MNDKCQMAREPLSMAEPRGRLRIAIISGLVENTAWLRIIRGVVLSVTIAVYWLLTDYPWDDSCLAYVWLNLLLGMLVVLRAIRWPEFLWAVGFAALLAFGNWRVF